MLVDLSYVIFTQSLVINWSVCLLIRRRSLAFKPAETLLLNCICSVWLTGSNVDHSTVAGTEAAGVLGAGVEVELVADGTFTLNVPSVFAGA